jgi:hypothetical protein
MMNGCRVLALPIALLILFLSGSSAAQPGQTKWEEADALFQAKKWPEAVKVLEEITAADPSNGRAWFRLGYALHSMEQYERAIVAYQKAPGISKNPVVLYNLACAHARLKQIDKAFEWLNKALNAGFTQLSMLKTDPDLDSMREDPRFADVLAHAARLAAPCSVLPQYGQFNFWVGEWEVRTPQGQLAGTNSVQRIDNDCVIFENWTGAGGGTGKSINFYDAAAGKWRQVWVGGTGFVLDLAGEYKDGAMRYEGKTAGSSGVVTHHKLTFFNLGPDKVRQLWEQSTDDGKNWYVAFDGMYIRKK